MTLMSQDQYLIFLICVIIPFVILFIVALILRIRKMLIIRKKGIMATNEIDQDSKDKLELIFGGKDNIVNTKKEMSRITVKVVDIDKVDAKKLKDFGATGVLLIADEVKCSFKENIEQIYKLLERN